MEKSKPSEEEIIKLGEKIVQDLQVDPRGNTLALWMSHYVAELILQIKNSISEKEKKEKKKECCTIILKIWANRNYIPNMPKPLSDLEPLIELLDALKENDYSYPFWRYSMHNVSDSRWKKAINILKNNSEEIFELCFYSTINSDLLEKKQTWLKEHRNVLDVKEKEMLEHLEYLVNRSKSLLVFSDEKEKDINLDDLPYSKRYEAIFDKIESEINEITSTFAELRNFFCKE